MHAQTTISPPLVGQLLVAAGLIDDIKLRRALITQEIQGGRLGETLVRLGHVSEADVTQALSNQLSVAWVSLEHVDFTEELLALVDSEAAYRLSVIPVHFRKDRLQGPILYIAMEDPTDVEAMQEVSAGADMHVRPLIAPPSELRRAIATNYERRFSGFVSSGSR